MKSRPHPCNRYTSFASNTVLLEIIGRPSNRPFNRLSHGIRHASSIAISGKSDWTFQFSPNFLCP